MRGPRHRARTRTAPGSREVPRVLARCFVKREALYLLGRRACATRRRLPARPATESVRGRGGGMISRQRVDPCRLATAMPTRSTIRLRVLSPARRPVHNPCSYGRASRGPIATAFSAIDPKPLCRRSCRRTDRRRRTATVDFLSGRPVRIADIARACHSAPPFVAAYRWTAKMPFAPSRLHGGRSIPTNSRRRLRPLQ